MLETNQKALMRASSAEVKFPGRVVPRNVAMKNNQHVARFSVFSFSDVYKTFHCSSTDVYMNF